MDKQSALLIIKGIIDSVQYDVEPILKLRNEQYQKSKDISNAWTIPRIVFPEIDGIARLRYGVCNGSGREIARAAVEFMKKYFPDKREYEKLSGFQYLMYRHTLLHSHFPRNIVVKGRERGWMVQAANSGQVAPVRSNKGVIVLDGYFLYKNFLSGTEKYMSEFDDPEKQDELLKNFIKAYEFMRSKVTEDALRGQACIDDEDFEYFND